MRAPRARSRLPGRHVETRLAEPVRELPPHGDLDADEVYPSGHEPSQLVEGALHVGLVERHPDPRLDRLAEQGQDLASDDPVGVDALDRRVGEALRLDLRDGAAIRLAEQLSLHRQVDRPGRDVQGQLLRHQVVFEQGHRERQRHAARAVVRVGHLPAVHDRARKRAAGAVEPVNTEQPEDRSLLAGCRGRAGASGPRAGLRFGEGGQPVERAEGGRCTGSAAGPRRC